MRIIYVAHNMLDAAEKALVLADARVKAGKKTPPVTTYHHAGDTERVLSSTLISRFIERT